MRGREQQGRMPELEMTPSRIMFATLGRCAARSIDGNERYWPGRLQVVPGAYR